MSFFEELVDRSEEERQQLREDPSRWEEVYKDVSGEFLPPEVGQLIAEFERGRFDYEKFLHLSTEKRKQFLDYVSDNLPVELDIREKTA